MSSQMLDLLQLNKEKYFMAIYNGREVQILNVIPQQGNLPTAEDVQIADKQGINYTVKLSQLQLTEDEKKKLQEQHKERYNDLNTVSDKDLQNLRDSQDEKKIQEKQAEDAKKQPLPQPVVIVSPTQADSQAQIKKQAENN